ncbi:Wdr35 [Symbiodinium sp. CCMP2456]|nr:Wdr35 [Symbiodinium sp. CCMP2456]
MVLAAFLIDAEAAALAAVAACKPVAEGLSFVPGDHWCAGRGLAAGLELPLARALRFAAGIFATAAGSASALALESVKLLPVTQALEACGCTVLSSLPDQLEAEVAAAIHGRAVGVLSGAALLDYLQQLAGRTPREVFAAAWLGYDGGRACTSTQLHSCSDWSHLNELLGLRLLSPDALLAVTVAYVSTAEVWLGSAVDWTLAGLRHACSRHGYHIAAASVMKFTANNSRLAVFLRLGPGPMKLEAGLLPPALLNQPGSEEAAGASMEFYSSWDEARVKVPSPEGRRLRQLLPALRRLLAGGADETSDVILIHEPGFVTLLPELAALDARLICCVCDDPVVLNDLERRQHEAVECSAATDEMLQGTSVLALLEDCGPIAWRKRWQDLAVRWLRMHAGDGEKRLVLLLEASQLQLAVELIGELRLAAGDCTLLLGFSFVQGSRRWIFAALALAQVYLSKKIAIPHQLALQVVSWNSAQGWIACGGESGLLKVLKLESASDGAAKAAAGQSNLSMNQTLEGHQGTIMVITWNENFRKLTTSDQNGLIIVWMLHRGIWFEEMINNRNRSVVRDMKWSADCQKICIIYEDGAVIVGTVDGQRLWGKEVKTQLAFVEWSPDGKNILFCTLNGEVHVYDNEGIYSHKVPIYCLDSGTEGTVAIAGIDWFAGPNGPENQTPTLCLGFENGRVQIMRSDADDKPVLLDTQLRCTGLKWDPNGSVVAIAGVQSQGAAAADREVGIVQFYAPSGQHLRSLRVPGQNLRSISWEGSGLRLALAVDSHIFFANIRPDYLWGYFSRTLVYAVLRKERNEHVVVFWDTHSDEKYTKYIKHVTHIRSSEEYCVLVTKADDASGQHIVIVCNDIGSPVDSKYMQLDPVHVAMTNSHVIVTSEDVVYIWSYRTSVSRQAQGDLASAAGMGIKQKRAEMMFHIDESFAPGSGTHDKESFVPPSMTTQDPIACICATEQCLLVARESGVVHRYALPHLSLEARFTIRCRPQVIAANCDSTRMSVIDINGVLLLFDVEIVNHGFFSQQAETNSQDNGPGKQLDFERKDVWNMRWAADNPDLFAIMEKTRMYIVRGLQPEEPVLSNAYICAFKDLQIQSVLIDEVIQNPENPRKEVLLDFETKSLRDTRDILTKVSNLKDAFNYVDANPHPRLWRLLAEAALEQLEFGVAEKAFVRFEDYQGIQLVKRLRLLDDRVKQKAEVAAYFQRFDEAESLYREIDRKDLAIDLRVRLGDWFRVIQLAHGANEELLHQAWSAIGDYYADRCKWPNAANYYAKAGNNAALVDTYYFLEDYDSLERLIPQLPEGSPLLTEVGNKFSSVGLCEQAVQAYLRHGDVKTAVDTCVLLNQWELAVNLAQQHNFQQIEGLLAKYAQHLLDKNKKIEAVQLYRKASRHTEAAKLLNQMAREMPGGVQRHPDRIKKLYLLAALEVEKFKNKTLDAQMTGATQGTMTTAQTLQSLVTQDQSVSSDRALESPWRGCEAFHIYLLSQRQLYEGQFEQAMKTSLRLAEYEDILDTQTIYSLIALTTYYNKYYMQCSKAFIKLEASGDISDEMRAKFSDLALSIFTRSTPKDPANGTLLPCPKCHTRIPDSSVSCPSCNHRLAFCVASGRSIFPGSLYPEDRGGNSGQYPPGAGPSNETIKCRVCRHRMYTSEVRKLRNCPLCHSRLDIPAPPPIHSLG